jgi:hypothetical protein
VIKQEIEAMKALRRVLSTYGARRPADAKKRLAELDEFLEKCEGSYAGEQAQKPRKQLLGQ